MRRSLSVRISRSPFKSDEERSNTIKKLADIKKRHAPKALALANTALAAMKKLRELEEAMEDEAAADISGECAAALLEFAPTFDDEAPDGESENGFITFENCIDAMEKAAGKADGLLKTEST